MYYSKVIALFTALVATANATTPPTYAGFTRTWAADFKGAADTLPPKDVWNVAVGDKNDNNEIQSYRNHKNNLRYSGQETLQIIPRRDSGATNGWTSGRIETKKAFAPPAGKLTRIESRLRAAGLPSSSGNKQGLWYAFWMMGERYRLGTVKWPECGELDIFENINGQAKSHGVAHCNVYPGGYCKEPEGLVQTAPLTDANMHVWRLEIDRRPTDWRQQKITWFVDGKQYHQITGNTVGQSGNWAVLSKNPYYMIFNVAVGGNWPGPPNIKTTNGPNSMLEVAYVAYYVST